MTVLTISYSVRCHKIPDCTIHVDTVVCKAEISTQTRDIYVQYKKII